MAAHDVQSDCATVGEMNELLRAVNAAPVEAGVVCDYVRLVPTPAAAWETAKRTAGRSGAKLMEIIERARGDAP
jgi:hypothetical protein